ncbi:MAG: YqaE/Pmp3 family membrane protein [Myxococcales bacterium]|nr:YqaE/Pmp3 family membrane protein [Myxococcales bacterium]
MALVLAFLLPPLGVGWKRGLLSVAFWLNLVLTAFFWVPGSIHALWVVTDE